MCSAPVELIVRAEELTRSGGLLARHREAIRKLLRDQRGYALIPSDTCYSLAVIPTDYEMSRRINRILDRKEEPISLAFEGLRRVQDWIKPNVLAVRLLEHLTPGPQQSAINALRALWADIDSRSHRMHDGQTTARRAHVTLDWDHLGALLIAAEDKWSHLANVQFWLGILLVPVVLIATGWLALGPIGTASATGGVFLSLLLAAAVTHSFLVLRIHQQARQAEERVVEKKIGLASLRVAVNDFSGEPEFEAMLQAGTQMFLGHHAAPSIPLGPEDLRSILQGPIERKP